MYNMLQNETHLFHTESTEFLLTQTLNSLFYNTNAPTTTLIDSLKLKFDIDSPCDNIWIISLDKSKYMLLKDTTAFNYSFMERFAKKPIYIYVSHDQYKLTLHKAL